MIRAQPEKSVVVKGSDMDRQTQERAIDLICSEIDKGVPLSELTSTVKKTLELEYGANWQCCAGSGFSCNITYDAGKYIYLKYNGISVITFRTGSNCVMEVPKEWLR
ncbi:unnamed protein product [Dibothriocephalus latus]|uniref:Dynein light chain n=1 Tax=Dibothriocephalus latus TaxID=60516 RepID=A0A3P7NLK1_DIBLA|nr:unnamed protein product [Dibothriocephalus latus]